MSTKEDQLMFKCLKCNKYEKEFNKILIKRFAITYEFYDGDINRFILLLGEGFYPYEYKGSWKIFDKKIISLKRRF